MKLVANVALMVGGSKIPAGSEFDIDDDSASKLLKRGHASSVKRKKAKAKKDESEKE